MATKKIKDIIIKNVSGGECSFMTPNSIYPVRIDADADYPIDAETLKKTLMTSKGVKNMFVRNLLIVENADERYFLGLADTNPLIKTYEQIVELLNGSADDLEAYLNDIADEDNEKECAVMQDLICKAAIDIVLPDVVKIKLIEDYTGKMVGDVIEEIVNADTTGEEEKPKKRNNKKAKSFE